MVVSARSQKAIQVFNVNISVVEVVRTPLKPRRSFESPPLTKIFYLSPGFYPDYRATAEKLDLPTNYIFRADRSFKNDYSNSVIRCEPFYPKLSLDSDSGRAELDLAVFLPHYPTHDGLRSTDCMNFDIYEEKLRISHLLKVLPNE
jgi:hypothetical protein